MQSAKLRTIIQNVLNKQGFLINITTVNDNYTKVVQQKLNGTRYTVKIHADAKEITRSVQASLMQVQSRAFGLQIFAASAAPMWAALSLASSACAAFSSPVCKR